MDLFLIMSSICDQLICNIRRLYDVKEVGGFKIGYMIFLTVDLGL